MTRTWHPDKTRTTWQPPKPGQLIALQHRVWRILKIETKTLSDADRATWLDAGTPDLETWDGRPATIEAQWVGGARPDWAPADGPVPDATLNVPASRRGRSWDIYPDSGRWPQCSCCGEPMPCQAELQDREVSDRLSEVEKFASRRPGSCWACGKPISRRQRSVTYPGENLDLPGGPEVRFHTRERCHWTASKYELRWIAVDPRRERILTYPKCAGILIVHADGSSECRSGRGPLGDHQQGEPDCRGHLTHDHGTHAACYVGDGWFDRPADMDGCPRGCSRVGHGGSARRTPRPERRQPMQAELPQP